MFNVTSPAFSTNLSLLSLFCPRQPSCFFVNFESFTEIYYDGKFEKNRKKKKNPYAWWDLNP